MEDTDSTSQINSQLMRELVFGIEDGMVSTFGAVTGVAIGSGDLYTILLTGAVTIASSSISMGIGSYLSNNTCQEIQCKQIYDCKKRILSARKATNSRSIQQYFVRDGWPESIAEKMANIASTKPSLVTSEMLLRCYGIDEKADQNPILLAAIMFGSYILGGIVPLISYILFPLDHALVISVIITLSGLFVLGSITTRFSGASTLKSGLRMVILGSFAFAAGLIVGEIARLFQ